jgi:hypothetical protein
MLFVRETPILFQQVLTRLMLKLPIQEMLTIAYLPPQILLGITWKLTNQEI